MPLRLSIVILILFLCGLWPGSALASGSVSGVLLYGAGQYQREVEGEEVQRLSTNYQQVALRYDKKGEIGDTRLGNYTLMLGYELNRINPSVANYGVRDPDVDSLSTRKPFYQAAMLIAPGGLPFRLSLYARDLHRSVFVDEGLDGNIPGGGKSTARVLDPEIFTGIENGTRREFGGTLLIGIRNGSYLGAYRTVLSQLPRLLIDYKQIINRDLANDRSRLNTRSRDLAFVSLNKLDNWVHFRMRDHTDYFNPDNDSSQKQVLIGLIDQTMQRKWINFTNWLKISSDLSYNVDDEMRRPDPERSYVFNMLAVGTRQNIQTTVFSGFSRTTDGQSVESAMQLPLSATIDFDRDTRLRSRFIYDAFQKSQIERISAPVSIDNADALSLAASANRDCYLDLQLEMLRSRSIVVVPRLEVEARRQIDNKGLAMRIGSEVYNKNSRANALNWLGGYGLMVTSSEDGEGGDGRSLENNIYGRADKDFTPNLRAGGKATWASGSGAGRSSTSFRIPQISSQSSTSSSLTLYFDHHLQQLKNRLEASYEASVSPDKTTRQISLQHKLDYTQRIHSFQWTSQVSQGGNSGAPAPKFDYLSAGGDVSTKTLVWTSQASYFYAPVRSFALSLAGVVTGGADDERLAYKLSEKIDYRLFTINGIIRRLAEFSEELGYEKSSAGQNDNSSIYGIFSAAYYPTRYLYGKLSSSVSSYPGTSVLQQGHTGEIGLDFEKLKLMASYSEGMRSRESANLPAVKERLWNMQVQKFF